MKVEGRSGQHSSKEATLTRGLILLLPLAALIAACSGLGNETPTNCSTKQVASSHEGSMMRPGDDCIGCHSQGEGPRFGIAGTVMGASNDDINCDGVAGVVVEITGSDGQTVSMTTNAAGNFSSRSAVQTPFSAKLTYRGKTRVMQSMQTDLSCNSCHTAQGANGAPGRVLVPN